MKKRKIIELQNKIDRLQKSYDELLSVVYGISDDYLTIEYAKKRDYIVRTKYIGKMKDKKLIEEFKNEFEDWNTLCDNILNYKAPISSYYEKLKLYEQKQIVIDVYGAKS